MIIDELFEGPQLCPECGGISFSDLILAEKKDACYNKVKASAKVWPSAYASGRLVQCRKKGAANYGNKSEGVAEGHGQYYCSTDKKWKTRQGPKQTRTNEESQLDEKWSQKYKGSINCSHPKGFSQKAHCAGKKKHNESVETEMVCEDCGMCESHGNLNEIAKGAKDSNGVTKCWPGKHAEGTKKGKNGGQVRKCVPNESVEQGVAEATGDQKFDSMMSQMTAEPKYPDQDMPPTSVPELIQWADKNNKPYHEYFAQWARKNGFKNVNDALVWFGDNVDPSNPWGPKNFVDPFGRPAAEELEDAAKHDPKAAELMKVFRCYEEIVFDWPDEYRQMNMPTSRKGTDEGVAEGSDTYKQGHAKFHTKTNKQVGPTHYGRGSSTKADSYTKADPRYHEVRPVNEQGVAEGSGDDFYAMSLQRYPQLKRVDREIVINALNNAYEDYLMHYGYEGIGPDEESSMIDYAVKGLKQGLAEAETDYQKRRQRERDVDAGKPVKPQPRNPQNDYFARRKKERDLAEDDAAYDPFANDPAADAKHEADVFAKLQQQNQQGKGTKIKDMNPIDRDQYLKNTNRIWDEKTQRSVPATKSNVQEVSLGDYHKKAALSKATSQMDRFFGRDDPATVAAADQNIAKRERGLARADARRRPYTAPKMDTEQQRQQLTDKYPNIDELVRRAEVNRDSNYEYADGQAYYDGKEAEQEYQRLLGIQRIIQGLSESKTLSDYMDEAKGIRNPYDLQPLEGPMGGGGGGSTRSGPSPFGPKPGSREASVAQNNPNTMTVRQGPNPDYVPPKTLPQKYDDLNKKLDQLTPTPPAKTPRPGRAAADQRQTDQAQAAELKDVVPLSPAERNQLRPVDANKVRQSELNKEPPDLSNVRPGLDFKDTSNLGSIRPGLDEESRKKREQPEAKYDDQYDAMVARVKKLAGLGPMKTVYDHNKRVYKNVPIAVQPKK